jgi:haloacetate dehalogenase
MFEGFERRRVTVGEVRIVCEVGGSGPPVLLLHGFPQCRALWARVGPILAADHTVVAADLRGYGESDKPPSAGDLATYSFRAMAADQAGLMAALGFERFHVVGHDRGGRTGHRLALDHPDRVASLAVLDIIPTQTLLAGLDRQVAAGYWHWFFLSLPSPFPERMIAADPDGFYESCLTGWGAARLEDFDPEQLAAYRRAWRDDAAIAGSCADYRSTLQVDFALDTADLARRVACPVLALWGRDGFMARCYDIGDTWRERCTSLETATLPGGHFFIDQHPTETAAVLGRFLAAHPL